jgi:hypothetical protein
LGFPTSVADETIRGENALQTLLDCGAHRKVFVIVCAPTGHWPCVAQALVRIIRNALTRIKFLQSLVGYSKDRSWGDTGRECIHGRDTTVYFHVAFCVAFIPSPSAILIRRREVRLERNPLYLCIWRQSAQIIDELFSAALMTESDFN